MPAMRSWWGSVLHEALIVPAPAGDAVARLCIRPSSCQAVSRRSRGPRVIERHPVEVRWAVAAGPGWTGQVRSPRVDVERDRQARRGVVLQAAEERQVGVAQSAEDPDGETAVPGLGQPLGVGRGGVVELHDGERLEERDGAGLGAVGVPLGLAAVARRGDQTDGVAVVGEVDGDRRGGGHGALERAGRSLAAVGDAAVVEEDGRARLPGLLLAAHHQLADAGRAAPVDAPQVVAAPVLADRDVLRAAGREGAGTVVARTGPRATERDARQGGRARCDGESRRGVERPAELDEAERVGHPHRHRADLELSAQLRAHLVGRVAAPPVPEALQDEARAGAEDVGESLLQQQHARGRARLVGDGELDGRGLPGDDELGRDRADEREAVARPSDPPGGEQWQHRDQHADAYDRGVPDHDRGHDGRDAGREERPSADGQSSECLTHGCRVDRGGAGRRGHGHRLHDPGEDRCGGASAHRRLDVGEQPVGEDRAR